MSCFAAAGALDAGFDVGSCGSYSGSPSIEGFGRVGAVEFVPIAAGVSFVREVGATILRKSFSLLFSV